MSQMAKTDDLTEKIKQRFAKLGDRQIVPCTLTEWSMWDREREKRIIGRHETETHLVSTVFLGLDHAFYSEVRPQWFETMIFDKTQRHELELGGKLTGEWTIGETVYEERYSTLEEAEQGHQAAIEWLKAELARAEIYANAAAVCGKRMTPVSDCRGEGPHTGTVDCA
jgi:hypothetical protein